MAPAAGMAARARLRRTRAAIPAGAIAPAGPDFEAAGPDFEAAGPDFEAARPDFEAAGPDFEAAGPDFKAAGPDFKAAGPDSQAAGPDSTDNPGVWLCSARRLSTGGDIIMESGVGENRWNFP